jgi:Tol biopolymer transport system component
MAATQAGVILGTAAYMSPEQARGKPVDKRADIWAFGVVLYELITGKRLFQGEDMTDTLARVVRDQSDLSPVPPKVRRLLERCLEKDPNKRLRDIGDAWLLLEEAPAQAATAPAATKKPWLAWTAAAIFMLSAAAFAFLWLRAPIPETLATQFQIDPPTDTQFTNQYAATAISPDGRYIVFGAAKQGNAPLWLRPLDSLTARPLQGTEGANVPFWSADSKSIAYYVGGKLKRSDIVGGAPQVLCDAAQLGGAGGTWNRDGTILFASTGGIFRVSSSGGVPLKLTEVDAAHQEVEHGDPNFLPDGNRFLYFIATADANVRGIYASSLDKPKDRVRIVATERKASYVPAPDGHSGYLLFMRDRTLLAQPFDVGKLALQGNPAPIAEEVAAAGGVSRVAFWTSDAGVLAYRTSGVSGGSNSLTWVDRQGKPSGTIGTPQGYGELALSPDGSRVAVFRRDSIGEDLWMIELARGSSTRVTTDPGNESYPVWSPDGKQIAYGSNHESTAFDLYRKPAGASGEQELLLKDELYKRPSDWSRDGRFLIYTTQAKEGSMDLWVLPMGEGERKPVKYLASQFNEYDARFSPDGRWVAYISDVSKRPEIYVSPFPDAAASPAVLVSTAGGTLPRWRRDGKGLYYLTLDRMLMEVEVAPGASFKVGVPKLLFQTPPSGLNGPFGWSWDVTADGQRFLLNTAAEQQGIAPLTILTNWQARLKK